MSKEAEELCNAINETVKYDGVFKCWTIDHAIAAALIDAAFAKVREECTEKQLREAFAAGARYGGWQNSLLKKDGANIPVPNFDTWYFELRSAILGTEANG